MPTVIAAGTSWLGVAEESLCGSKQGGTAKKFALETALSQGFFCTAEMKKK